MTDRNLRNGASHWGRTMTAEQRRITSDVVRRWSGPDSGQAGMFHGLSVYMYPSCGKPRYIEVRMRDWRGVIIKRQQTWPVS